jgi:hypothetical protein
MHLLEVLARTGRPTTVDELRREGVAAPAQGIYDLQLAGYEVDRVAVGEAPGRLASGYRLRTPVLDARERDELALSSELAPRLRPDLNMTTRRRRRRDGSARIGDRPRRRAVGAR